MKHIVILAVLCMAAATAWAQDWEGDLVPASGGNLDGSIGVSFDSQYIWRGFDVFDDTSAVHFLADLNLFDTGLGASVVGHRANGKGFEDAERWDYTLYYQNGLFPGEAYMTNFRVGWVYYNYPELNRGESTDLQEGQAIVSWPNLLPIKGLCPSYVFVKMWPSRTGSPVGAAAHGSASGFFHIFMLDYGFTVPGVLPEIPEHLIKLHSEVVFNDGCGPDGRNVDNDWSHAVFGVSTDLNLPYNLTLTPAAYYQVNMEETVNNDSYELWAGATLRYSF